ncbi:MAG: methenyltetrahydromethanopterin cyclohydrolase [Thermoleophilia bacterium]
MISVNERSAAIVREMIGDAEALGLAVRQVDGGGVIVDAGVEVPGSLEAGRLFAEACLGGLGNVVIRELEFGDLNIPGVEVEVSQPSVACMASQYAGWAITLDQEPDEPRFLGLGSGPARARYRGEPLFEDLTYVDPVAAAVLALETRDLPPDGLVRWLAAKCNAKPQDVYVLVAPTASIVGSVQIAARIVETGLHKMHELGYQIDRIISGFGTCPLASVAGNDLTALGWTNDVVLYGGRVWYTVQDEDSVLAQMVERLPSASSRDYGARFEELWEGYGGDFYEIDPLLFSPAEVWLNNVETGRTFKAGGVDTALFRHVFES